MKTTKSYIRSEYLQNEGKFKGIKVVTFVETFLSHCDKRFHNEMNLCRQTIAPTTKLTTFTIMCWDVHAKTNSSVNTKSSIFAQY